MAPQSHVPNPCLSPAETLGSDWVMRIVIDKTANGWYYLGMMQMAGKAWMKGTITCLDFGNYSSPLAPFSLAPTLALSHPLCFLAV